VANSFVQKSELRSWLLLLLILLAVIAVYSQVYDFAFVSFDDPDYVVDNSAVNHGLSWASIKWAFTTFFAANWHPLTWLSHMLDVTLFGLKSGYHHLASLGWHVANTILLFFLLRHCWGGTVWRSVIVTALFAWHPLRVESVAWVAERKDLLCAFFWLLTLISYSYYSNKMNWKNYLLVFAGAGLALQAKPMAVTLPFLLLVLDYWPLQRYTQVGIKHLLLEKIPLFLLIIISAVLTFAAQYQAGAVSSASELGLLSRCIHAVIAYGEYVKLLLWPQNLAVLYRYRIDYSGLRIVVSIIGFIGSLGWVFHERKRYPFLLVGWCWFVGTLVPVIGLVQVGGQAWADRYTYFPAIGFWLALVWLGAEFCSGKYRQIFAGIAIMITFIYLVLSWRQIRCWKNSVALFQQAVTVDQENSVACNLLGLALIAEKRWMEVDQTFARALKSNSCYGQALVNWGNALSEQGRNQDAELKYRKAMNCNNRDVYAFVALATLYKKEHRLDEAVRILRQALLFAPDDAGVNYNLGTILLSQGHLQAALKSLQQALRVRPAHIKTRINLAIGLAQSGSLDEALKQFSYVLQIDPENSQVLYNMKQLEYMQKQRLTGAGG